MNPGKRHAWSLLLPALPFAGGLGFLLVRSLGFLKGFTGSRIGEGFVFRLDFDAPTAWIGGLFVAGSVLLWLGRGRIAWLFERMERKGGGHPVRLALALALVAFGVQILMFLPFRYNLLRLPSPDLEGMEIAGRRGRLVTVPHRKGYEDYTRNLTVASAIRRLGPSRYFELHRAEQLTPTERHLCGWALRNHPPGYHFLLAPFTFDPVVARLTSVVLYALLVALGFLFLEPLIGSGGAILGALFFWASPGNLFFIGMMTANDLAAAFFILLALIALVRGEDRGRVPDVAAGFILGIAFLVKYTSVLALLWALLYLIWRERGFRALPRMVRFLAPFLLLALAWGVLLSRTEWGAIQWNRYISGMLRRGLDPHHLGRARSAARGTLLDFFVYLTVEMGPPLFLLTVLALGVLFSRIRRITTGVGLSAALYGIALLGAILTIPKSNYILFAQVGLFGVPGFYLARSRHREAACLAACLVILFGILRVVLLGIQTW